MIGEITLKINTIMLQKHIWTLLLITGILSSQCSCKEKEAIVYDTFKFYNNSEHLVTIKAFYFDIDTWNEFVDSIEIDGELIQETEMIYGSRTDAFSLADSIQIIFDDTRKSTFIASVDTSEFNILSLRNYSITKQSDERNVNNYNFTLEDYNYAK
jgi:hypothetical protein